MFIPHNPTRRPPYFRIGDNLTLLPERSSSGNFTNPGTGWWYNAHIVGGGMSNAWFGVDEFLAFWISQGATETWNLDELGLGDIIVYDYHGDAKPYGTGWDHVAILTSWYVVDGEIVPRVTGRGYIDNEYLRMNNQLSSGQITQEQYDQWEAGYDSRVRCDPNKNDLDTGINWHWYKKIIGLQLPYTAKAKGGVPIPK